MCSWFNLPVNHRLIKNISVGRGGRSVVGSVHQSKAWIEKEGDVNHNYLLYPLIYIVHFRGN